MLLAAKIYAFHSHRTFMATRPDTGMFRLQLGLESDKKDRPLGIDTCLAGRHDVRKAVSDFKGLEKHKRPLRGPCRDVIHGLKAF